MLDSINWLAQPLRCTIRMPSFQKSSLLACHALYAPAAQSHALEQRDAEDRATALATAAQQQGILLAFGRGQQVPKRIYTIDELRLNKVEPEKLLSPKVNA